MIFMTAKFGGRHSSIQIWRDFKCIMTPTTPFYYTPFRAEIFLKTLYIKGMSEGVVGVIERGICP